jgi:cytochrome c553
MKIRVVQLLWIVPIGIVAGLAFIWIGLFNVAASSGHWPITAWLLHLAMQRSVAFRAGEEDIPQLNDPALIRRGAGHYEQSCAVCHGDPARPQNPAFLAMVPPPPPLSPLIEEWDPEELFWIVKHGVKFTGMPAWPAAERDDEVWAVTAFLLQLPELSRRDYRALVGEQRRDLAPDVQPCAQCHGPDGTGDPNGAFPRLDIQSEAYLAAALEGFSSGERASGIMQSAVGGLDPNQLRALARYYAEIEARPVPLPEEEIPAAVLGRGEELALRGDAGRNIPACSACHGQDARAEFPRLDGQYQAYLANQLRLFAGGTRGGAGFSGLMETAAHSLDEDDIEAVSAWYARRQPQD